MACNNQQVKKRCRTNKISYEKHLRYDNNGLTLCVLHEFSDGFSGIKDKEKGILLSD